MSEVKNGDLSKMGLLYERHKAGLYRYFYRCTNDQMKSEDLVQNVFMRVIRYRERFSGDGEFAYWLFYIARNTWIDDGRKKDPLNHKETVSSDTLNHLAYYDEESKDLSDEKVKLKHALQKISPEKRDAIILSRYHGLTYKTIADMSDCTENAIKSRVQRGIMEIREVLQNMNYGA